MDFSKIKNKQLVISTDFDINDKRLINVDTPIDDKDSTNKKYVDDLIDEKSINNALGTGLYSGGLTTLVNNVEFTVQAGTGYIVDSITKVIIKIEWLEQTVTRIPTNTNDVSISIGIDDNGDVYQQIPKFTSTQRRNIIVLGEIILDTVTHLLKDVLWYPIFSWDSSTDVDFKLSENNKNLEGNLISANGSNLKLDVSAGKIFGYSINAINSIETPNNISLSDDISFSFSTGYYNGNEWVYQQVVTDINPNYWSNGTTNLQIADNDKFNLRLIFRCSISGDVRIMYPTQSTQFDTLSEAERFVFDNELFFPDEFVNISIPCAYMIIKGNSTDLSDPLQSKVINISTLTNSAYGDSVNSATDVTFDDTTSTLSGSNNVQTAIDLLDTNDFSSGNINMIALTGTIDSIYLATTTTIMNKPLSRIRVYLNSLEVEVGNATTNADCYFSNDSGVTPKAFNNVEIGDELYWNSAYDNMQLDNTDLIDFVYITR